MINFHFNESLHEYTIDSIVLPSVTQVINSEMPNPNKQFFTETKRNIGTEVHRLSALYDGHVLVEQNCDNEVEFGYLKGWIKFLAESNFKPDHVELPLYHGAEYYAGTIDRIGTRNGKTWLIDIKTGLPDPGHLIQVCAYAEMAKFHGLEIDRVGCVYLKSTGRYSFMAYTDLDFIYGKQEWNKILKSYRSVKCN